MCSNVFFMITVDSVKPKYWSVLQQQAVAMQKPVNNHYSQWGCMQNDRYKVVPASPSLNPQLCCLAPEMKACSSVLGGVTQYDELIQDNLYCNSTTAWRAGLQMLTSTCDVYYSSQNVCSRLIPFPTLPSTLHWPKAHRTTLTDLYYWGLCETAGPF